MKITALLTKKGVIERKYASTIATILGLQYNSAKQKLDGKRGITHEEVKSIFEYFNEPYDGLRKFNCTFILGKIHKRCNVKVQNIPAIKIEEGENYAIKKDGNFIIDPTNECIGETPIFKVESIDFLSAPKIAILDNDNDILELLKKIAQRYGINSETFRTTGELMDSMKMTSYDGYVLDWLLDYSETSENVVKNIREEIDTSIPIIILTGQLNHYEKNIGKMIVNHNIHLVEKPAKPLIISSLLLSNLFFY